MHLVLRIVLLDPFTESREHLRLMLADMDSVWVEAECPGYDQFPEILEQSTPDIVVIGLDSDPVQAMEMVLETARACPQSHLFVTSRDNDSQKILQAMRAGAKEYLTTPVQMDDLLGALDRVRATRAQQDGDSAESLVVAVTGAIGGVGSTCLAVNLGCCLAADPNRRAVLVDLDMVLGDADVCLDIVHNYTLLDVVENIERLDFTLLKQSLVKHSCGLSFLPHPHNMEDLSRVRPENLKRLIALLKATFTHVVLDLSNGFRETDSAAMEVSDVVLLVAQLSVSSLRNVSRVFRALEGSPGILDRVRVVLNRVGSKDQNIPLEKVEEVIGRPVYWEIPSDWKSALDSRNSGVPLVLHSPRSKVSTALFELAAALAQGKTEPTKGSKPTKRRGLFSLLR